MERRQEARDQWEIVFARYRGRLEEIGREFPRFWEDVRRALALTPAVVPPAYPSRIIDTPEMRDASTITSIAGLARGGAPRYSRGTQTDPPPGTRTVASQTTIAGLARGGAPKYSRGTQTSPPPATRSTAVQTERVRVEQEGARRNRVQTIGTQTLAPPMTVNASSQTDIAGVVRGGAPRYSRGTQTEAQVDGGGTGSSVVAASTPGTSRSRSPCRGAGATSTAGPGAGDLVCRPRGDVVRARARPRPTRNADQCWRCGDRGHVYSTCPRETGRKFCYGCGKIGVTLRDCPTCREEWEDLGPYLPRRGHIGKRPER